MKRNKDPLDEVERGKWKSWLKTQHSKNKDHGIWSYSFMASRWGNNGNRDRVYFLGSKITAVSDCSHEILKKKKKTKLNLFLGSKAMTNLDSILKSRDVALPTKIWILKAMVFPVVIYGYGSWTIKKAECWRIDAFEFWFWRRLFRVPWTRRRSSQSILKEINR